MVKPRRSSEFELIRRYFAPLAASNVAALGLGDDAARLVPEAGRDLILTTDTIVEGVHFPVGEAPDHVARRLMRVNLSDLAAKGARPDSYLLNTAWTSAIDDGWIEAFTSALAEEQARYGIALAGGDTVSTPGPLTLTLTAVGSVASGRALLRGDAALGDLVFVSGTIGDGMLGLWAVQDRDLPGAEPGDRTFLADAFRTPEPRLALGQGLAGEGGPRLANACADVSDGLLADLGHICDASGVGAEIDMPAVPLSEAAARIVATRPDLLPEALAGGDDYELVFTAPADRLEAVMSLGRACATPVALVGRIVARAGVSLRDGDGREIAVRRAGFSHA